MYGLALEQVFIVCNVEQQAAGAHVITLAFELAFEDRQSLAMEGKCKPLLGRCER